MNEVKKTTTSVAQSIALTCGTWFIEVNFTFGVKLNYTRKFKDVVLSLFKTDGDTFILNQLKYGNINTVS